MAHCDENAARRAPSFNPTEFGQKRSPTHGPRFIPKRSLATHPLGRAAFMGSLRQVHLAKQRSPVRIAPQAGEQRIGFDFG